MDNGRMDQPTGSLATLRTRLAAHKGKWPHIADTADVPISTLRKVAQGVTPNPRVDTVDRLNRALDSIEGSIQQ